MGLINNSNLKILEVIKILDSYHLFKLLIIRNGRISFYILLYINYRM